MRKHSSVWTVAVALSLAVSACVPMSQKNTQLPNASGTVINNQMATSTDADAAGEKTPDAHTSLEVPATLAGRTATGYLTLEETIAYGSVHCCEAAASDPPKLMIFFDYDCEYCREFELAERPWIDQEYVLTNKIAIERLFVPITPWGRQMAIAGLCAAEQKKFDALDRLLLTQTPSTNEALLKQVKLAKLNRKEFDLCMQRGQGVYPQTLHDQVVDRVPTFAIGPKHWQGLVTRKELKATLDQAIKDHSAR